MNNKRLFIVAYNNKEWHTIAHIMNNLGAEYIEGCIDASGELYNTLIKYLPIRPLEIMIERWPFNSENIENAIKCIKLGVEPNYTAVLTEGKIEFIRN